eukprot:jgi/Botrbrau1/20323/Bobra.0006s0006.1
MSLQMRCTDFAVLWQVPSSGRVLKHQALQIFQFRGYQRGSRRSTRGGPCHSSTGNANDPYSFSYSQGVPGFDDSLFDLKERLRAQNGDSSQGEGPPPELPGKERRNAAKAARPRPKLPSSQKPWYVFRAEAGAVAPVEEGSATDAGTTRDWVSQGGQETHMSVPVGTEARVVPPPAPGTELHGGTQAPRAPVEAGPAITPPDGNGEATKDRLPEEVPEPQESGFKWAEQWYPVHRTQDIPEGEPTRVWLFQEPYVVLRRPGMAPVAMLDRCPHRQAALSEGRMTSGGNLQCAYHGWTFQGETGHLVSIPQVSHFEATPRSCAKAVPCIDYQGLIWIYPSPGAKPSRETVTGLPELDREGWTHDTHVRDMPIDFTLLLENVADPDHGVFAHQTPIFDTYTADREHPMLVVEEPARTGTKVVGRVPGTAKLFEESGDGG